MKTLTLLIDADPVAYAHSAAGERRYDWEGDGDKVAVSDPIEDCIERCRSYITDLKVKLKATDVIVALSDPKFNFRKDILPSYKANRAGTQKPEHLMPIKQWLGEEYRCFQRPRLEADDILGILATHPTLVKGEKIIVSIDKDLGQIPGKWYDPGKKKMRVVTREEGDYLHYRQMLTGDAVDGYSGCPGVGPVKADALIDAVLSKGGTWVDLWQVVAAMYALKGLTDDDALVQARVSKILQFTDYDFKRKEPILWNPPA